MIKAYVDGACSGNGKENAIAGWAFVLLDENNLIIQEKSGRIEGGTNNIGELTAIIKAIENYKEIGIKDKLTVYSDSSYCITGINEWRHNWKKNNWWRNNKKTQVLKNREQWIKLDNLIDEATMFFEKIAGHSTEKNLNAEMNNYVDKKAVQETK